MPGGHAIKSNVNVRRPASVGQHVTYHGDSWYFQGDSGQITASHADMSGQSTDGQLYTITTLAGQPLRKVRRQDFTIARPVTATGGW